jgi:hypothetical protein
MFYYNSVSSKEHRNYNTLYPIYPKGSKLKQRRKRKKLLMIEEEAAAAAAAVMVVVVDPN